MEPGLLDNEQRLMRTAGQGNADDVIGSDDSIGEDDGHDACLANEIACRVVIENGREEPGLKALDLRAGIPQARELENGGSADAQLRATRELEQWNPLRGNVLPDVSGIDRKPALCKLGEQFSGDEMNLPKVRLRRIAGEARQMLDGAARVRITINAEAPAERDGGLCCLAEAVSATQRHTDDNTSHDRSRYGKPCAHDANVT